MTMQKKYKTILIDPPWKYEIPVKRKDSRKGRAERSGKTMHPPYPMMDISEIEKIPVNDLADDDCHLWLWTTNKYLPDSINLCKLWGFKYFHLITWIKPSGMGMWFVHRTQPLIFAYKGKMNFKKKCNPNVLFSGNPKRHSEKPECSYELIESISSSPKLEMFARRKRDGWDVFVNEVEGSIIINGIA